IGRRAVPINPNIARVTPSLNGRLAVRPQVHISPNLNSSCEAANRDGGGECVDVLANSNGGDGISTKKGKGGSPRRDGVQTGLNPLTIANELVAEIDGSLTTVQADAIAGRHRLRRVESQNFALIGATIGLFRITDRRSVDVVSRELATEASVRSVQPSYRYVVQEQKAGVAEGDPAQYELGKLRLPEA